jgi:hypothetical protein
MATKKVRFGVKPKSSPPVPDADTWVQQQALDGDSTEPMKRLTIDIPEDLHRRLKISAASQDRRMVDLVREWIRQGLEKI